MTREQITPDASTLAAIPVVFRTSPNWTAVIFFFVLSALHFSIALPAFYHGRIEGYMSLIFAVAFLTLAIVMSRISFEMTFVRSERQIRLRSGLRRLYYERCISFDDVHAVRLIATKQDYPAARIEVLCDNEDIECPIADEPRRQALCLAVLMGVQLIRVSDEDDIDEEPTYVPENPVRL
jgi:hypothetical protein